MFYKYESTLDNDLVFWSNATADLRHNGEIGEDDLPDELLHTLNELWTDGHLVSCYLVELKGRYGIALESIYDRDFAESLGITYGELVKRVEKKAMALPFIQVDCRGWDIFENRARNLREAAACESLQASQGYHNSWLTLHEDKKNKYDPNAIELLVRGETFGNAGYIAKEQTEAVRKLAELCSCKVGDLHVTIARKDFDHLKNVPLVVYGYLIVKDESVKE